jgi:hypothetical protein
MTGHGAPLDRFMPRYDVRERFETTIRAPADLVMDVACHFDMQSPALVKAIFWTRDKLMGGNPPPRRAQGILEETKALGWGVLANEPGKLIICGARCQPWLASVRFSEISPLQFAAYDAPNEVKIAWTLEVDAFGPAMTHLAQETRAVATDDEARVRFLRYWRWARFGIIAIRLLLLPAVRRAAEARWSSEQGG